MKLTAKGRLDTQLHAKASHNKSGGGSFGMQSSDRPCNRFPRSDGPGPGEYEVKADAKSRLDTVLHAKASHNKSGGGSFGMQASERPCNKTPRAASPGPGEYELKIDAKGRLDTLHQAQATHNKTGGGSFGLQTSERPCNKTPRSESPGPGEYEPKADCKGRLDCLFQASSSCNKSGGGSFGMQASERPCNKAPRCDSPGPGEYELKIDAKGRLDTQHHANASHNKSGGGSFGMQSSDRPCNRMPRSDGPGPGEYDVKMTVQGRLETQLHAKASHNKSGGGSFGLASSERPCNKFPRCETPAPGEYEVRRTRHGGYDTAIAAS